MRRVENETMMMMKNARGWMGLCSHFGYIEKNVNKMETF